MDRGGVGQGVRPFLVTDLYEVTMVASYVRRGMLAPATFSLFVRRLPPSRGFLVAAGIDEAVDRMAAFEVTDRDVDALTGLLHCPPELLAPLRGLRFAGDVRAVDEGRVVLADEPLLEVTASLPQAQLVETAVLNAVAYQVAVASKAVRCTIAARGTPVVDFGLRRTHGAEAGMAVARATAVAGFAATSNVGAAIAYGLRATGTMAHSYVQAFASEHDAFSAFASEFPSAPTFLVDTYDTPRGIDAAIAVIVDRGLQDVAGIRLDSGDLAAESRAARARLDAAGLTSVKIIVSGGLDENDVDAMRRSGAPVDVFAVGTKIGVVADAPVQDAAYKLVAYEGRPTMKLSPGKAFWPGPKQVWRRAGAPDVVARRDEPGPEAAEPLLSDVVRAGVRVRPASSVADARARLEADLAWLPPEALDITAPRASRAVPSDALSRLAAEVRASYSVEG
ncbi:MAG TPA: nicotinate phosphoribosyltransferase [Cellulomonas sp.]|uniref:nicotinate phosphoribosyltransferase n=1 Tax=Cellulomonas sp. TaxID=40001 RepID=UPI002E3708D2|nr:nicotinate phosphoribosyltransferase [Cellulomonas sp.]HEX5332255.1 nicotinate phosphoribosyltransferase [Cellulomonas sp.]